MAGRQIGIVVDGDRVLTESARRLDQDHDVVGLDCGDDDLAVGVAAAVDEQFARRRTPVRDHRVGQLGGQRREPLAVACGRDPDRVAGQLTVGEPVGVLAAAFDERVHQGVTVSSVDAGDLADAVAGIAQRVQQCDGAGRGVQPDRVADPRVFGRVRREHQGQPLVGRRDAAQGGVLDGQAGHPGAPLRVGHIGDQAVGVDLLERERDRDDAPVEFRHRHLGGDIQRAQAVVVVRPGCPRAGQAQPLQDRDIKGGKVFDVPVVVVVAGARGRRAGSAGGQHGDHHGVGGAQQFQQFGFGGAQRGAVHRKCASAGLFDRGGQRLDVGGVAGQLLGPVVQHRDRRPVGGVAVARSSTPQAGVADGWLKPNPVISRVSDRNACSCRRFSTPPWAR